MARRVSVVAAAVGSAAVVASGLLTWVSVLGSDLSGFRMAELVGRYGDTVAGAPAPWWGVVWYVLPLAAIGCWLWVFARQPLLVPAAVGVAGGVMLVGCLGFVAAVGSAPGPWLASFGSLLILLAGFVGPR